MKTGKSPINKMEFQVNYSNASQIDLGDIKRKHKPSYSMLIIYVLKEILHYKVHLEVKILNSYN